jgi:hypothetical protein
MVLAQAENFDESATLRRIANCFVISRSLVRLHSTAPSSPPQESAQGHPTGSSPQRRIDFRDVNASQTRRLSLCAGGGPTQPTSLSTSMLRRRHRGTKTRRRALGTSTRPDTTNGMTATISTSGPMGSISPNDVVSTTLLKSGLKKTTATIPMTDAGGRTRASKGRYEPSEKAPRVGAFLCPSERSRRSTWRSSDG